MSAISVCNLSKTYPVPFRRLRAFFRRPVKDPVEALRRVIAATWRHLGRYHALVASTTSRATSEEVHERHAPVLHQLLPLIQRGQASGAFRADVSASWHLSMLIALIHAASAEARAGRVTDQDAEAAVVETVLGAVASPA